MQEKLCKRHHAYFLYSGHCVIKPNKSLLSDLFYIGGMDMLLIACGDHSLIPFFKDNAQKLECDCFQIDLKNAARKEPGRSSAFTLYFRMNYI